MQATEYFNVGRWANFGRRPDPPLPHQHRGRPKWCRDDGQSIKTFDRSHYEFRLILHRRLITHTHTHTHSHSWKVGRVSSVPPIHIHLQGRAHTSHSWKGPWRTVSAVADDALAENGAISRQHNGWDGMIDYGNIFSVEARVKQHTSLARPSPRGHPNSVL